MRLEFVSACDIPYEMYIALCGSTRKTECFLQFVMSKREFLTLHQRSVNTVQSCLSGVNGTEGRSDD